MSSGRMGFSKHHQAFGKTNRNKTNNILTSREINKEISNRVKQRERKNNPMFSSVRSLFAGRTRR